MTLTFTVLGVAAPQGSFKAIPSRSTGRPFLKQSCARTMPWRKEVAAVARVATQISLGRWPTLSAVLLRVTFYLPRPKGHHGKRGLLPSAPRFPTTKPDLSKLVRALEDALTGIVYRDDAQIVKHRVEKLYSDGEAPRAIVEVELMESST